MDAKIPRFRRLLKTFRKMKSGTTLEPTILHAPSFLMKLVLFGSPTHVSRSLRLF